MKVTLNASVDIEKVNIINQLMKNHPEQFKSRGDVIAKAIDLLIKEVGK